MKVKASGMSDIGKKRKDNEDSLLIDTTMNLYIVCDGVSGQNSGKEASQITVKMIQNEISENFSNINRDNAHKFIEQAIEKVNFHIYNLQKNDPNKKGMATTLDLIFVVDNIAIQAHVGDSRTYLLRENRIHLLTEDHSYTNEMIKLGRMTEEEAQNSKYKSVISRAVGLQETIKPDFLKMELSPGDQFLLCSDGLNKELDDQDIYDFLINESTRFDMSQLIQKALSNQGRDNVTVLSVYIEKHKEKTNIAYDVIQKLNVLGKINLFKYLTYPELIKLLEFGVVKEFAAGNSVIKEGDLSDDMYILIFGKVKVSRNGQFIAYREEGALLGEMGLIDSSPRSASVQAEETSTFVVFKKQKLFELMKAETKMAIKIFWMLCMELNDKLRDTTSQLVASKNEIKTADVNLPFV